MTTRQLLKNLSLVLLLAFVLPVFGLRPLAQQPTIGGYLKISEKRVERTIFEYVYRATLTNPGTALSGATASVISLAPATTAIVDGNLTFGPVAAGGSVLSSDTFTFRHDRSVPFDFANLQWTVSLPSNHAPTANAGADFTRLVGQTAQLNGSLSSDPDGNPLTYSWSFLTIPTGSASVLVNPTSVNPTFLVDKPGAYMVQLVVNDGTTNSPADTVIVTTQNSAPIANAGPDQSAAVSSQVTLDGSASSDVDGNPLTFSWSFQSKPGASAAIISNPNAVQPTFTVDVAGQYVLRLVVNDGTVNSAADTMTVSTSNSPPVANAGPDQTAFVTNQVTLNGSASSDPDGNLLTFAWSFVSKPAGSAATLNSSTAVGPTFVIDKPGSYTVRLVVNDGFVNSPQDLVVITTQNSPPVANAGPDQSKQVAQTATLDGSASSDVDGDPLTYLWSLTSKPAGSTAALNNTTAAMPTFTIDQPGNYVAQLIVNDGFVMSAADSVTVSTTNSPPVANAGPDQSVVAGQAVALNGLNSSDVDGNTLTYLWSFTSVPLGSTAVLQNPTSASPTFTADRPGQYIVQLIVNDGLVNSAVDTVNISTTNLPPTANAGPDQLNVPVGSGVTVDGSLSSDPDSHPLTYAWSLSSKPAGSTAALSSANTISTGFTADRFGDYVVQLIVNDGFVGSAPDTVLIRTANRQPVANAGPDQNVTTGAVVTLDGSLSTDPDGQTITKQWAFTAVPAGSTATLSGATSDHPTFTADRDGTFVVELTVTDSLGSSATDSVSIVATAAPVPVVVSVVATDGNASEPGSNTGTLTFTRTGATTTALQVFFSVGGTATSGNDYVALPASIAIPIGQASAALTVTPVDDQLFEVNEGVSVTLSANANYGIGTPNAASVTIADDDVPVVSIAAFDANASEVALDPGIVRFSRNGNTSAPLTIDFTVSGTATSGSDFTSIGTSITFPATQATVDLTITPITDALAEGPETVIVTTVDGAAYNLTGPPSATVTIADAAAVVTVQATDAQAAEDGTDTGTFTFTRTGSTTAALTVSFTRSGTATPIDDYTDFPLSVAIPIGQSSATVTVTPVLDALVEPAESVQVSLAAGSYLIGTPNSASVSIADSAIPVVTVQATDANAAEPGADTGTFTFSRTGSTTAPLTVTYTVGGTAASGTDYTSIGTTVTFGAGQATATKTVTALNDAIVEPGETVIVTLVDLAAYNLGSPSAATVTIADNPVPIVTVSATDANASESGPDTGTFRFSRAGGTAFDLIVTFTLGGTAGNGTDYQTIATTITIPAGQATVDRIVTPLADASVEPQETVIVTIVDDPQYNLGAAGTETATVTITDGAVPLVTVVATDPNASEIGLDPGTFTVTRTGATTAALSVSYAMSGSALNGTDYASLSGTVSIPIGQASATVTVTPATDALIEGSENAILTLTDVAAYDLGTPSQATVTIEDTTPTVTVAATDPTATEGSDTGTFTFTRTGSTASALTVNWSATGTATFATDYSLNVGFGTLTFAAGQSTATMTVTASLDAPIDNGETVIVTLSAGAGYFIGSPNSATVTINDATPTVTVAATDATATEGTADTGTFTFTRTGSTAAGLTVNWNTTGSTATFSTDYSLDVGFGTATFAPGASTATVTVTAAADAPIDNGETVVVTIQPGVYAIGSPSTATVTIADATPTVTVVATDATATEGTADTGTFTFTRTGSTTAGLTVSWNTTGSTATFSTDYSLNVGFGTATFAPGSSTATVTVTAALDAPIDNGETLVVTIQPGVYAIGTPSTATVTIADATPTVTVAATDATATEGSADTGTFTFTRTGSTTAGLTVNWNTTGSTATFSTDYSLDVGFGTATFAPGASTATVTVTAATDAPIDNGETVVVTIQPGVYAIGTPSTATVTIADATPTVTVVATDATATEGSADTGTFTFTRTGSTAASLTVNWNTTGSTATFSTDYSLNVGFGTATFAPGSATATVTVTAAADALVDNGETVVVTIQPGVYAIGTPNSGTVTIAEVGAPSVTVVATDPSATEGGDTATFTFTRVGGNTAAPLSVNYNHTSSTALLNTDYTTSGQDFTGQITFAAGQTTALLTVSAIQDVPNDPAETVLVNIAAGPSSGSGVYVVGSPNTATVTINDSTIPIITVVADPPATATEGATGTITFTRAGGNTAAALSVNYTHTNSTAALNTDYTTTGQDFTGQLTFAAGQTTKVMTVSAIADVPLDNNETVVVNLTAGPVSGAGVYAIGAPGVATITILDAAPPLITVGANAPATATEGGTGTITFSRSGGNTAAALSVSYTHTNSTALLNTDYTTTGQDFTGQLTFAAGQTTKVMTVSAIADVPLDNNETVVVNVTAGPVSGAGVYAIGTPGVATITILDAAPPLITVVADAPATATEGGAAGTITFTRTGGNTAAALSVSYTHTNSTALLNTDYTTTGQDFTGQLTFAAGQTTKVMTVSAIQDVPADNGETAIVNLTAGPVSGAGVYALGTPNVATITIVDSAPPVITVVADPPATATEGGAAGTITFTRTGGNTAAALSVSYNHTSSTAVLNTDYTTVGQDFTGQLTFAAGQTTKVMTVSAIQDVPLDNNETAVVNLTAGPVSGAGVYAIGAAGVATITILDSTPPVITVVADPPATATEGGATGTITFTRTGGNTAAALSVSYNHTSSTAVLNTDYTTVGQDFTGQLTFAAGQTTKVMTVSAIQDVPLDNNETAVVNLTAGPVSGAGVYAIGAAGVATITILDNAPPVITVVADPPATATEGGAAGTITFTRTGGNTAAALSVSYNHTSSTAVLNTDYTTVGQDFTGQLTFAAGQTTKVMTVSAIQDVPLDNNETAVVNLTAGPVSGAGVYAIGNPGVATVTILDTAPPVITIVANAPATATEGGATGTFTVTRTGGNTAAALSISYSHTNSTASLNVDYTTTGQDFTGQLTFAAGQTSKVITVTALTDAVSDPGETVVVNVTAGPASGSGVYAAGNPSTATINVINVP